MDQRKRLGKNMDVSWRSRVPVCTVSNRAWALSIALFGGSLGIFTALLGCQTATTAGSAKHAVSSPVYASATRLEKPFLANQTRPVDSLEPMSTRRSLPTEFWDLTLEEVVQISLTNSNILRDLGGQVLRTPDSLPTRYEVGIAESDPRYGVQAALSEFDAQVDTRLSFQKNDRVFNNNISGLGVNQFKQDMINFQSTLTKTAATGTRFSVGNQTIYDANNSTTNLFPSAWDSQFSLSARHPLLRGGGTEFNRIAGPSASPGFYFSNGVLLARVNTDISVADFEAGVINFVNQVETAYWELYFAYRNLDAVGDAKQRSNEVVESLSRSVEAGVERGFRQLAAEVQIHALDNQYQSALNGVVSASQSVGVYRGERQLRWLMGLPTTDGRLIRPSDLPVDSNIVFDWSDITDEAMSRRVELRRQGWVVKKRQLELLASKNFILPQLDLYSTYRLRGFGDQLLGGSSAPFNDAFRDIASFDHQELEGGVEFSMPVGYRQGWAAIRNARLKLTRETSVLEEQQNRIVLELSDAVAEVDRSYDAIQLSYRRLVTAQAYRASLELAAPNEPITTEARIDAINQIAEAEVQYHRSMADYMLALKDLHRNKGSLLQLNGVFLQEGPWPCEAYKDAIATSQQWIPRSVEHHGKQSGVIAGGEVEQSSVLPYHFEGLPDALPELIE